MSDNTTHTSTPLVSVIVPVYMVEGYIVQCAESLFRQDYPNVELIFVDNNTPDRSIELLEGLLNDKYPQCKEYTRIVKQEKLGLGYAREAGLRVARGEYIIHVDSDDWVEPNFISALTNKAIETNADIVYCKYYKEYDGSKPAKVSKEPDMTGCTDAEFVYAIHNSILQAYNWNKLERRSLYGDIDKFIIPITNMNEDIVFQSQIAYGAKVIVHLPEPLYHYRRRRKGAITKTSWRGRRMNSAQGMLYFYRQLPKRDSVLEYCEQDVVMRMAWYALSTFHFSFLHNNPDVMKYLLEMQYVKGRRVPISKQRIMKGYCTIYKWLHPQAK